MTTKETVLDIIDTVRNRNDACQYTAGLIEGFVKLIDDESFPVSDGCKPNPTDNGKPNASANWIPCSERLPEDPTGTGVFITAYSKTHGIGEKFYRGGKFHNTSMGEFPNVTHWQPLPNPPTSHK